MNKGMHWLKKAKNTISISSIRNSRLLSNMSWLFILNFSNTIIPYFTFPYITRVFLPEGYGALSFSLSFVAYFQTFIDYGFNLTGARRIATIEDDGRELSKVYTTIIATKFMFFLISVPVMVIVTLSSSVIFSYYKLIFIFILMAFSHVLMPTWMFQGLQRVRDMTIISLSVRVLFVIGVFTLIKTPDDITLYAILYSSSFLCIAILSIVIIRTHIKIRFCKISFADIKFMIKDGFYVFTSSAVISLMGSTGIFVLGLFHSAEFSGYYSGISKINQAITMLFYPIGQALFPYHSKKYKESFHTGYRSSLKIARLVIPIFLLFAIVIIIFRKSIVGLVLGNDYILASDLLMVMAFFPTLSIISNFLGTQILVASNHTKEYSRAFLRGATVSIALFLLLGYFYAIWGVAAAALGGAIANLIFLFIEVRKVAQKECGCKL